MIKILHPVAGVGALATIVFFWTSTIMVELLGDVSDIQTTKRIVLWGLILLVPLLAAAGGSGHFLAGASRAAAITHKRAIMKYAAINGLLVLVPCAIALDRLAVAESFGSVFVLVQAAEILAGGVNIVLLAMNMIAGLKLTHRFDLGPTLGRITRSPDPTT